MIAAGGLDCFSRTLISKGSDSFPRAERRIDALFANFCQKNPSVPIRFEGMIFHVKGALVLPLCPLI